MPSRWFKERSNRYLAVVAAFVVLVLLFILWPRDVQVTPAVPDMTRSTVPTKVVTVRRGDFLRKIADANGVGWEALLLVNEKYLMQKYQETCGALSERYRNNPNRDGTFCNDRYRRPYANTLLAGWTLSVPASTAPEEIKLVVSAIQGERVALVIDDTGSMTDDRSEVSQFYLAALRSYNKKIVGVYLYADGSVRKYEADGSVNFENTGARENTFGALLRANRDQPDQIILVTDEQGDDWDWAALERAGLPPTIAHCLANQGVYDCRATLQRLSSVTRGTYVADLGR